MRAESANSPQSTLCATASVSIDDSDGLARQWLAEHGDEYAAEKLAYFRQQPGVKSPASYLSVAIREEYKPQPTPAPSPEAARTVAEMQAEATREDAAFEARQAERAEHARRFDIVAGLVGQRNPTQRDAGKRLFIAQLDDDLAREDFRARGWMSALNAAAIFAF